MTGTIDEKEKLWQKFDSFFWSSKLISREAKQTQHIRGHRLVSDKCLLVTRVLMLLLILAIYLEDLIQNHKLGRLTPKHFYYLTNQGCILTIVYFIMVVAASTPCLKRPSAIDSGGSSPWYLWKWSVTVLTITLNVQLMVTIVFWGLLFPNLKLKGPVFRYYSMHIVPVAILHIDLLMNAVCIEFRQILLNLLFDFYYFMFILTYTKVTGKPLYSIYTFDSVASWVSVLSLFPFAMIIYCATFGISYAKCKLLVQSEVKGQEPAAIEMREHGNENSQN